ncbi:MAG: hypothetical protein U0271_38755 [Polyangiaceae bacterium]
MRNPSKLIASLIWLLAGCAGQGSEPPASSSTEGASTARGSTAASAAPGPSGSAAAASAAASAPPPEPPPPPASDIAAAVGATCADKGDVFFAVGPERPKTGEPLRAFALALSKGDGPLGVVITPPGGAPAHAAAELRHGPPESAYVSVTDPEAGTYRLVAHRRGAVVACRDVEVKAKGGGSRSGGDQGTPWMVSHKWDKRQEALYSAWIEKLFDAPGTDVFAYGSLHELTTQSDKNFLYDYLDIDEDAPPPKGLRLDPDCADLPYFLRAYFSFKMGLPFTFSACSRGGGGRAPSCGEPNSNLEALDEPVANRVRRFETFVRGKLKNTVHSGTGRTLAKDDRTDYYAIHLSAETLRPGAIYADPYGHVLVAAKIIPQPADGGAGILFAVDGQPDGTVSRKRFWKGNFLFSLDDPAMGSPGFKRFRPVVVRGGNAKPMSNKAIAESPDYGDFSLEQTEGDATTFYDRMDDVLSPKPLDPERALLELVDALEEQAKARVLSVENGEKFFREGGSRIDMPNGASIFETVGNWENFSTPSRDLRILIAIDVVSGFPALVARRPERFTMPAGKSADEVVAGLKTLLASETEKRQVTYVRSDASKFTITLAELMRRQAALEMAYNPNDCAELRWGATQASDEANTCKRRAPSDQRSKMEKVRAWFHDRKRPSRG